MPNLPKPDLYAFPLAFSITEPYPGGGTQTTYWNTPGMTLRDYFATAALGELVVMRAAPETYAEAAQEAYAYADAMLKARQG